MKTSGFIIEENRKIVASVPSTATPTLVKRGVAPLRAGEGHSFLLRRLHSLSGIVPVGLFLIEHFISKDRKSTRLNSSHDQISYAVFCLKKKKNMDMLFATVDTAHTLDPATLSTA